MCARVCMCVRIYERVFSISVDVMCVYVSLKWYDTERVRAEGFHH